MCVLGVADARCLFFLNVFSSGCTKMYFCVNMHWNTRNEFFFLYYFIFIFLMSFCFTRKQWQVSECNGERERRNKQQRSLTTAISPWSSISFHWRLKTKHECVKLWKKIPVVLIFITRLHVMWKNVWNCIVCVWYWLTLFSQLMAPKWRVY